jgi:uncharacterized repeat protein (TIGR03803 family)
MMSDRKLRLGLTVALTILSLTFSVMSTRAVAQEKVLYSFDGDSEYLAAYPISTLIFDAAGNLYGTGLGGGTTCGNPGCGTVFELSPQAGGGWNETVLHEFRDDGGDQGYYPHGSLVADAAGNLYGTAYRGGGGGTNCGIFGGGAAFELLPAAGGGWRVKVLHSFGSLAECADGGGPWGGMIFDAAGNLYGTTTAGGANGWGTVFELSPSSGGRWTETVLHSFNGYDGQAPYATLTFDSAGNLYGTTSLGGTYFYGTVFELSPITGGNWKEKVLHSFDTGAGGYQPQGAVVLDTTGNVYATTAFGGTGTNCTNGCGTVFELSPAAKGWTKKTLHYFTNNGKDGSDPVAGLIFDSAGNLYGTTELGGDSTDQDCDGGCGTVFELAPSASGGWNERILYNFGHSPTDGIAPEASLVFDAAGNLYGATYSGGAVYSGGTVFEVSP